MGVNFAAELAGVGDVLFELAPKRRAMAHDAGVRQLMPEQIVNQLPRQLHDIQVEGDIASAAATAPPAFELLNAYAAICITAALSQGLQSLRQQCLGLLAESFDAGGTGAGLCRGRARINADRQADADLLREYAARHSPGHGAAEV